MSDSNKFLYISADNSEIKAVNICGDSSRARLNDFYHYIGCDLVEIVPIYYKGNKYCMIIDEEGKLKSDYTVNICASYLFDNPYDMIVGSVLIGKDKETDDGLIEVGLSDLEIESLIKWCENIKKHS